MHDSATATEARFAVRAWATASSNVVSPVPYTAGPTGGTVEKPIGLVYIALAHIGGTEVREVRYGTEPGRSGVRYLASQTALDMIRMHLAR